MNAPATASPAAPVPRTARAWQIVLLWAGVPLCLLGMVWHRLWEQWPSGRFGELLLLSLLAWGLSWPLRRFARWPLASAFALIWLLALVLFAGVLPVLATVLLGVGALAVGGLFAGRQPVALQTACGMVIVGAALAWLLPVPLHTRWSYLALCVGLVGLRHRQLAATFAQARQQWQQAIAADPRTAALAVLALGLGSVGTWLPTMQFDDVGYHLRLPWQLLEQARYVPDPETHIWALAPWLGDVLQAIPQLISGAEARGPVNALWMLLTACGLWQLAHALKGDARAGWTSIALYASLPLTATLAGSMQTEAPTTALLVWLAVLVASKPQPAPRALYCGAILVGGLLGLKLASLAAALLLLPWALWTQRPLPGAPRLLGAVLIVLLLGGSSFVYAGIISGNPFLPLFNGWFHSPYFAPSNFSDARWHAGFNLLLPWDMTFNTPRYLETFVGGGGFVLIALLGAWLLAFTRQQTRVAAVVLTLCLVVPLIPMQYLRYVFPASVVLLPLLVVTALHFDPRRAAWLLAGVCVLNLAFQANGHWTLRIGGVKQTLLSLGDDHVVWLRFAPERILIEKLRADPTAHGNVMALDAGFATVAEMGSRGRTISAYDPSLAKAADLANADPTGAAWQALWVHENIGEVLLRPQVLTQAQRAGLQRAGATQRAEARDAQWWSIPPPGDSQ